MLNRKLKVIFVCTVNKMRSKTAEVIYRDDERFEVRSAGVAEDSDLILTEEMIEWADFVVVMERKHFKMMQYRFPGVMFHEKIVCLDIPDFFMYMAPELVKLLKERFEPLYEKEMLKKLQWAEKSGL